MSIRSPQEAQFDAEPSASVATLKKGTPGEQVDDPSRDLRLALRALSSFFCVANHPFTDVNSDDMLARDWSNETRIAAETLLQCIHFALAQVRGKSSEGAEEFADWYSAEDFGVSAADERDAAAVNLADSLGALHAVLEGEGRSGKVGLYAFTGFRTLIDRQNSDAAREGLLGVEPKSYERAAVMGLIRPSVSDYLSAQETDDLNRVISRLSSLLEYLRTVGDTLRFDRPPKQTLPFFTLIHEEAKLLLRDLELFSERVESISEDQFNALDGTKFAVSMELRKVFSYELAGLSSFNEAPAIYARVENAHGLLRDSFQQSIVALAQLFDPEIRGTNLFDAFQTRLDQSLALRNDLWYLLQLVRRAEKERDRYPISNLIDRLAAFRNEGLRYLMFKDWEACERFIEEVGAAHGAIELAPVLNRFSAFLETLHGQVNMRAVLAEYPFQAENVPGVEGDPDPQADYIPAPAN